ncbi:MAG: hypothetical protein KBT03_04045 [Bacteroidales bacterium]|nr:hypothetical protein [Candidatus Scybalousia scybalohippi]
MKYCDLWENKPIPEEEYKQLSQDIEQLDKDLELIKDRISDIQVAHNKTINDRKPIIMLDVIEEVREIKNWISENIERLSQYYE